MLHCKMSSQILAQLFCSYRDSYHISNSPLKSFIWWFLFLFHLEFKFKKHSNLVYRSQWDILSILLKSVFCFFFVDIQWRYVVFWLEGVCSTAYIFKSQINHSVLKGAHVFSRSALETVFCAIFSILAI